MHGLVRTRTAGSMIPTGLMWAALALNVVVSAQVVSTQSPTHQQKLQTVDYIHSLGQTDGGFSTQPGKASTLAATAAALRALHYWQGTLPSPSVTERFVMSHYQQGSFVEQPGGKPSVMASAMGWMALAELKHPLLKDEQARKQYVAYLEAASMSIDEIRITAATIESLGIDPPAFLQLKYRHLLQKQQKEWQLIENDLKTPQKAAYFARLLAGVYVTEKRLKVTMKQPDAAILLRGQWPNSAWGKEDQPPDLESTYRVVRALVMMNAKPRTDELRRFVDACRQQDGGYALAPGTRSDISATYFAGILYEWLREWEKQ